MTEAEEAPPGVDASTPSAARLYDYYLGGKSNFPVDRLAGDRLKEAMPDLYDAAWANRGFHQRSAIWMAKERGIRQFIDIGSGLPTQGNTHQAVKKVATDVEPRVVYVDNDPMVKAMAKGLLSDEKHTAFILADMRDPDTVLGNAELRALIDFSQPVGLLMTAVFHFVADGSDPLSLVKRYTAALAPGSYLALTHATADWLPARVVEAMLETYGNSTNPLYLRPRDVVLRFFDGLELEPPYPGADPGISYAGVWGAEDPEAADTEGSRVLYCGVARRP
jgi:S-adenosyl methyltransferase